MIIVSNSFTTKVSHNDDNWFLTLSRSGQARSLQDDDVEYEASKILRLTLENSSLYLFFFYVCLCVYVCTCVCYRVYV